MNYFISQELFYFISPHYKTLPKGPCHKSQILFGSAFFHIFISVYQLFFIIRLKKSHSSSLHFCPSGS